MSLQTVVEECLQGLGYELVELDWQAGGHLRVFIEHAAGSSHAAAESSEEVRSEGPIPEDGSGIRIEDCEKVSHQLSHVLLVEDIDYARLEVSSPGLDRPLRRRVDFERFVGSTVSLKLRFAVNGRRNFEGVLQSGDNGQFALEVLPQRPDGPARKGAKAGAGRKAVAQKAAAKSQASKSSVDAATVADAPAQRLVFELDDVERARLVPRLKF